ncbi:flagellar biosynthesis anti-sigma factor FlgM [Comamonadaceae bacterium M7527]|nr:flagellar biosynthesis anti-sigma factor FlgM [Comamonadaceae bacterium M7527]
MTNPITQQARVAQPDLSTRQAMDKAQKKSDDATGAAASKPSERAAPKDDMLSLSDVAQKAMAEPEFDRAKVDGIKQAIRDGNYPLNARRIAENFVAIEQMIQD